MTETTTIRVRTATREKLKRLAEGRGSSVAGLVDALVEEAGARSLLDEAAAAWERMAAEGGLESYRRESAEWDATLADGLTDE